MEFESDEINRRVETRWEPAEKTALPSEVPTVKRRVRVAAYCRVSTDVDVQMNSLETQKRRYLTLVTNTPEWELVGIYKDQGVTGTDRTKRIGFQRMIRHCEEGKIDKILCKSVSRFGRNTGDILDVIQSLKERNIGVFFEKENIDTLTENSEFVLSAMVAIAQDESRSLSENINWALKKRFQQGKPMFTRMLGYSVKTKGKEKVISIIEEEAVVIREIFNLALEGMSFKDIAERMIEKGYRTVTGKDEWTGITIKCIIRNERYTGDVLCQKIYTQDYLSHSKRINTGERPQYLIENYHPAIISRETYNQVQRFVRYAGVTKKRKRYPFSGRLHCGECGAVYQMVSNSKDPKWKCRRSRKSSRLCSSSQISETQIIEIMKRAFELRYGPRNPSIIHRIYLDVFNINVNDNFEKQRLTLDNKLATAVQIEKNSIGSGHYRAKVKRQKLEEKITQIEKYWNLVEEDRTFRDQALEWLDKLPRTEKNATMILQLMSKELMRALVMEVILFPGDSLVIRWADDTETKIDDNNLKLLIEQKKRPEPKTKVRKYKSIEDSVTKTDLISQAIKVNPQKTMNYKPLTWLIPEIQDDDDESNQFNRKKVCAYCRVSTNSNDQLSSFELQVSHYTKYILSNESWKFSGIYADEGASGTSVKKRPNFLRMIEDCKAGKIDLIITKSISRFARNTVDCLTYVRMLKALSSPVGVYFERENINTLDDNSEFLLTIFSGLAQDESRSLSESARWGIKKRFEHGIATVPISHFLGYRVDKFGNWTVNEEEAKTVRKIFREYLEGKSLRQIATDLTKEGVKTGKGKTVWAIDTVYRMLINEKYCGDILLQKQIRPSFMEDKKVLNKGQDVQYLIEDHHIPIIPKEDWCAVQQKIHRNQKQKRIDGVKREHHTKEQTVFVKMIFCGECGTHFMPKRVITREPQKEYFIWKCKAANYFVPGVECQMEGYYEEEIENAFMLMLLEMKQKKDVLVKEVRKAARSQALTYYEKRKVELLRLEIKSLHKKTNQEDVLTQSDDSSELIGKVLLRFSQEHERLQTKLDKLEEKSQQVLLINNNLDWLLTELKKLKIGDPLIECIQFRGDIFRRLVSRCLVFNDARIIFEMNIGISREIRFEDIALWKRRNEDVNKRYRKKK